MSTTQTEELSSVLTGILKPGSSLHPTFLVILDAIFLSLLIVFVVLAILTSGSIHIFALMAIEIALWASVKWFVKELNGTAKEHIKSDESKESRKDS